MADISRISVPEGNTYDLKDIRAHFYGECETAAGTAAKTVSITNFTEADLVAGTTIRVKFTAHNTVANATLNINSIGAYPIYRYGTTAPGTAAASSWQAGSIVTLTFNGTGWIIDNWLNDNTTYSVFSNLVHTNGNFVADSAVYRYQLLFHTNDDTLTPLNNVNNGYNKTNKAILTNVEFDPFNEIFYYSTTTNVAANAAIGAGSLLYASGGVDLRYSLNISASVNALTAHQDVYMKVSPQSTGRVKLAAEFPLVQDLPVSNDGYWYIFLGRAYSTYQISLYPHHPVYKHNGTSVVQLYHGGSEYVTKTYANNTYAQKYTPVFAGDSFSFGRLANSTVGSLSVAIGTMVTASGNNSHAEGRYTVAEGANSHAEGNYTTASGENSHAEGSHATASALDSHAEGHYTTASYQSAHAEGANTEASGSASHAEGDHTTASGWFSHAEGHSTISSGLAAHAEGDTCTASASYAHAEGCESVASGVRAHAENTSTASGSYSHSEGLNTESAGGCSHAEGEGTIAHGWATHVFGKFNTDSNASATGATDVGTMVEIVGNGTDDTYRSNARTLDWSGNETLAGTLTCHTSITIGNTTITEAQLATLVSLAAANGVSF